MCAGVINIVGNFGTVFVDQVCYARCDCCAICALLWGLRVPLRFDIPSNLHSFHQGCIEHVNDSHAIACWCSLTGSLQWQPSPPPHTLATSWEACAGSAFPSHSLPHSGSHPGPSISPSLLTKLALVRTNTTLLLLILRSGE